MVETAVESEMTETIPSSLQALILSSPHLEQVNSSLSFLSLPPEIRTQIYTYCLPPTLECINLSHPRSKLAPKLHYRLSRSALDLDHAYATATWSALIRTCKTIHAEALSVMYNLPRYHLRWDDDALASIDPGAAAHIQVIDIVYHSGRWKTRALSHSYARPLDPDATNWQTVLHSCVRLRRLNLSFVLLDSLFDPMIVVLMQAMRRFSLPSSANPAVVLLRPTITVSITSTHTHAYEPFRHWLHSCPEIHPASSSAVNVMKRLELRIANLVAAGGRGESLVLCGTAGLQGMATFDDECSRKGNIPRFERSESFIDDEAGDQDNDRIRGGFRAEHWEDKTRLKAKRKEQCSERRMTWLKERLRQWESGKWWDWDE